jgi:hypothetical protein
VSQGKLNGLTSNGSNNQASQPGTTQPYFGAEIAQQGMAPQPNQSQIGQFSNSFGAPGPVGTQGSFGSQLAQSGAYPVIPQMIDRSLVNGPGPDVKPIGPVSPVSPVVQDQLNGLPGPDGQQYQMYNQLLGTSQQANPGINL